MHDLVEPPKSAPSSRLSSTAFLPGGARRGGHWLYTRLAFQNLLKRPTRTSLLVLAVTLAMAAIFSSFVIGAGINASISRSFARMGADLVVVPEETMVNITSALLTVQPTDALLDPSVMDEIKRLDGVAEVSPQTILKVPIMAGMPSHKANLIAFDPATDFTVRPWLDAHLDRPIKRGDLICGGRRTEEIGEEVQPCNTPATIHGKLGRSGVGPFDESFFATYETAEALTAGKLKQASSTAPYAWRDGSGGRAASALLVRLKFGATAEQVRFSIARIKGVKVIAGTRIVTATRETTLLMVLGMMAFSALMISGCLILIGLLFSAIISERRRELGLLRALGARRTNIAHMLMAEAGFATFMGGIFGVLLGLAFIALFQNSLVFYLQTLHVDFVWPSVTLIAFAALFCALAAAAVGLLGAVLPAWRASANEPYRQIQGEV